ncbi:HTH_48 domain-containing protein [Trichonephila clavipes]|nr:HTH_48 domain-containing protein [Trichonephila clavipes]
MRRVSAKFVPRLLTEDQQFQRLATSSDLFQSESYDPEFMKLIITGDESWVYGYDPETKQQSSQWKTPGSPRPKKARQDIETIKQNSTQQLQAIPKSEFQKCFEDWKHHWAKCVTANGAYFEGD